MKTKTKRTSKKTTSKMPRKLYLITGHDDHGGIYFIKGHYEEGVNGTMWPVFNAYGEALDFLHDHNEPMLVPMKVANQFGLTKEDFAF